MLRFESIEHAYFYNDVRVMSVTQMLEATGWVDPTFYTRASRDRGTAVHRLAAAYDLGSLPLEDAHQHRGYVLAYADAMRAIRATWDTIEEPLVHPGYPFAGTPDRVGTVLGVRTVLDIKSGAREASHPVQTALYAILIAGAGGPLSDLPATSWARASLYLKPSGKYSLEHHPNRRDLDAAYRVLETCCPRGGRR